MDTWKRVWREGVAPTLSTEALQALYTALEADDPALLQGATCDPPPLEYAADWPVVAACGIGYCGWRGEGLRTVQEVEAFFHYVCAVADQRLGHPAAVRFFLNWFDDTPREEMRTELLAEVSQALAQRVPEAAPAVVRATDLDQPTALPNHAEEPPDL
jgi:hypothetical protein